MTPAAKAFVSELALAVVSTRPVRSSLLDPAEEGTVGHIELADWPDLVLVAPAPPTCSPAPPPASPTTSPVLLATRAPVLWAPAMNTNMWRHPATQQNLALLRERGAEFVGPDRGALACGWIGEGRMIDPALIVAAAICPARACRESRGPAGRVLVSAGPTRTYIDPVRFVANASTGAMGFAVAAVAARARRRGHAGRGPVELATPPGVRRVDVETAAQMHAALEPRSPRRPIDLVAMVAAVSDLDVDTPPASSTRPRCCRRCAAALARRRRHPRHADRRHTGVDARASSASPPRPSPTAPTLEAELLRLGAAKLRAKRRRRAVRQPRRRARPRLRQPDQRRLAAHPRRPRRDRRALRPAVAKRELAAGCSPSSPRRCGREAGMSRDEARALARKFAALPPPPPRVPRRRYVGAAPLPAPRGRSTCPSGRSIPRRRTSQQTRDLRRACSAPAE
jgi:phosphopantothenoylcysteine decarboxylase/phosphopantothenate--cysteine ligase